MTKFQKRGAEIRKLAKQIVLDFMNSNTICGVSNSGMKQATIFRECGFDWGDYDKATSSRQQYWIVALLRDLEAENKIEQVRPSGPWRIK